MINKLMNKIQKTNAPIVVGLDPMLSYVPSHIQQKAFAEYGETLEGAAEAIWQFNKEIIDKTYDLIPAVKPQIAMYEQFTANPKTWLLLEISSVVILAPLPQPMQWAIWEKYRWEANPTLDLTRILQRSILILVLMA